MDAEPEVMPGADPDASEAAMKSRTARALELTAAELAFMKKLAPYVGSTPRRALQG